MIQENEICLALDTALDACSVGIASRQSGETVLLQRSLMLGRGHAEHLMDQLELVLNDTGFSYQDLTRLAVTVGPGSFTGLRVGLATARALALALDIPLIGTSTLHALALTAHRSGVSGHIACLVDARRNQIYGQLFEVAETARDLVAISDPAALSAEDFASKCQAHADISLIGSGAELVQACDPTLDAIMLEPTCPDMEALALWALDQPAPSAPPSPLYLRGPDAKPQASKAIARQN